MVRIGKNSREYWVQWISKFAHVSISDAEDIVSETILYFIESFNKECVYYTEQKIENYLDNLDPALFKRALYHRALNLKRSQARQHMVLVRLGELYIQEEPIEEKIILKIQYQELINSFPEESRRIAERVLLGFSWSEISAEEGISVSAAKMRFARGVSAVRRKYGVNCDDLLSSGVKNVVGANTLTSDANNPNTDQEVHDADEKVPRSRVRANASGTGKPDVTPPKPCRNKRNSGGG